MTGMQALYARAGVGVLVTSTGLAVLSRERFQTISSRSFDRAAVLALGMSRIGIFVIVFLVLGIAPRGDVPAFYYPQALLALAGQVPSRDFVSSYAPLHAYMDAAVIAIWHSPLAIVLLAIFAETLLLPLWLRLSRKLFAEPRLRIATVIYVASPLSVQFVAIDGQDNVLIALLLVGAVYVCWRSRSLLSGCLLGLSVVLVKFLPLIYAPVFLAAAPRRLRWVSGFAAIVIAVYGGAALLHASLLASVSFEAQTRTASNLPYLLEAAFGAGPFPVLETAGLCAGLIGVGLVARRACRDAALATRLRVLVVGQAGATLALLLFSRKSWPPYLLLALFPLCLVVSGLPRLQGWLFAAFSIVAITAHSVWATLLLQAPAIEAHHMLLAGRVDVWIFGAFQCLLTAGYIWLFAASLRELETGQKA